MWCKKADKILILILMISVVPVSFTSDPISTKSLTCIPSSYVVGPDIEPISNNTFSLDKTGSRDMVIDDNGFVYILGNNNSYGQYSLVLTKWNSSANLIWSRVWDNGSSVEGYGMVSFGNYLYVVGRYIDANGSHAFLMNWDSTGNHRWIKLWDSPDGNALASDIAIAPDGALYVVASSYNSTGSYYTSHALKYSLGGSLIWYRELGPITLQIGQVTVTGLNEIYTGFDDNIKKFNASGYLLLDYITPLSHMEGSPSGNLYTAAPMDPDSPFELNCWNTTGMELWSAIIHTPWNESVGGIDLYGELASVPDDSVYILFPLYEAQPNLVLARYDSDGVQLWNRTFAYPYKLSSGSSTTMNVIENGTIYLGATFIDSASPSGFTLSTYKVEDITPYPKTTYTLFDPDRPQIDHPSDLVLNVSHNDFTIVWNPFDAAPERYEIHLNDSLIRSGNWNSSDDEIAITISELSIGTYNYTLIVFDESENYASDSVLVIVRMNETITTVTTWTYPVTPYPSPYDPIAILLGAGIFGGIILIALVISFSWREEI